MAELTPLMKQYLAMKEKCQDQVLFFRLGDFYEMFFDDAKEISRLLNLTLTHRGDAPMCGIPFHAAKNYIKRLLTLGKKIAICEQVSLPTSAKEIAKREIVQIITPATVVEQELLKNDSFNYLMAIFGNCICYCDISTGDLYLKELGESDKNNSLTTILEQVNPSEVIVCDDEYFLKPELRSILDNRGCLVDKLPASYFSIKTGFKTLCDFTHTNNLSAFGLDEKSKLISVASATVRYIEETAKLSTTTYFNIQILNDNQYLNLDEASRKNLELFSNNQDNSKRYCLFETIDKTLTSGGQRLLSTWLSFPLRRIEEIIFRQDWIKFFVNNSNELKRVKDFLKQSMDLQRLSNRVALRRAIPKDLVGIKQTLSLFFSIISENTSSYFSLFSSRLNQETLNELGSLMEQIHLAINEACNGPFVSGQVILDGYDEILDQKRSLVSHSQERFDSYLNTLKEETGIVNLKIVNSRISGYVIEVSKGQTNKAPDYFVRRQTLTTCERYTTDKLKELESESFSAESDAEIREKMLYDQIITLCSKYTDCLNDVGRFLSTIDCFCALASLAIEVNYVCPTMVEEDVLQIKDGRHPVVEKYLPPNSFVANDTLMDQRFFLITGPNMAGKSTYLRQTALIVLLAHIGSFVPASSATIGITDSIYCRVGASDNLAKGESTFLVEMQEAAFILRTCTNRSLVIMDEIGRGTSTQEGMSIAHAIINYLLKKNCKTLFATHFHELTQMDTFGMGLYTLSVKETPSKIEFLRKLIKGSASSSYAMHVARMAGVPNSVIKEANLFLKKHFAEYNSSQDSLFSDLSDTDQIISLEETRNQLISVNSVLEELVEFDLDSCTPIQALIKLQKLKERAKSVLE